MPTIHSKPFNEHMQSELSEITTAYHAGELSKRELSERPDDIHIIKEDGQMVGYGVIWEYNSGKQLIQKAEKDYFSDDEKYLEKDFYIEIKNQSDYIFIEALDVLKEFERKGYAAFFVNWLKEKYPNKTMFVYTLDKTRNFWYKQGFQALGRTVWMTYR